MKAIVFLLCFVLLSCSSSNEEQIRMVDRLSTQTQHTFYIRNQYPLKHPFFIELPVGNKQAEEWLADNNAFTQANSPLVDKYGLCAELPYENAPKSETLDDIKLVSMGTARLRIADFPSTDK